MKKISVGLLLVLLCTIIGCQKNNSLLSGIVATEEVENKYGTVVEVSYADDTKMYFRLLSDTTAEVVNYHRYYLDHEGSPWVYRGDISIPEKFVHNKKTYKVTCIGEEAFAETGGWEIYYGHISLVSSVEMPSSIDTIRDKAFRECKNMNTIVLPNSVVYIGEEAFWGTSLDSIVLPPSLTFIGKSAFSFTELSSVKIPESVSQISPFAFYGCKNLIAVAFHDQLESIGDYAFAETGFRQFEIPPSLTSIGLYIIEHTSVTALISHPLIPPLLNSEYTTPYIGICESLETIYVPTGSVEAYKEAVQWQRYKDIIVGM